MKVLTKVAVGSRLHGLDTPDSDWDYRGIHMHSLKDIISPFKKIKNTTWIEGDEDNTSYELIDFCKNAVQGNATILEVFFSDQIIESTTVANDMRANWRKFIDTDRFVAASQGYAHNQYKKMNLFESKGVKGQERTAKFAVAYVRVLWQCSEFLRTGEFPCTITEPEIRDFLREIKPLAVADLQKYLPKLTGMFSEMQARVVDAYTKAEILKPDIKWIEEFLYHAYTNNNPA